MTLLQTADYCFQKKKKTREESKESYFFIFNPLLQRGFSNPEKSTSAKALS